MIESNRIMQHTNIKYYQVIAPKFNNKFAAKSLYGEQILDDISV